MGPCFLSWIVLSLIATPGAAESEAVGSGGRPDAAAFLGRSAPSRPQPQADAETQALEGT